MYIKYQNHADCPNKTAWGREKIMDVLKLPDLLRNHPPALKTTGNYEFEDLPTSGPACCDWDIRLEIPGVTVEGKLDAMVQVECARCLEIFEVPVGVSVHERYVFSKYVDEGEQEKELHAEDFYEVVDEDGELDLKDLAHQLLILETSDDTLCGRTDCRVAFPASNP